MSNKKTFTPSPQNPDSVLVPDRDPNIQSPSFLKAYASELLQVTSSLESCSIQNLKIQSEKDHIKNVVKKAGLTPEEATIILNHFQDFSILLRTIAENKPDTPKSKPQEKIEKSKEETKG